MCGITGFCDYNSTADQSSQILTDMTNALTRRGPDDSGEELFFIQDTILGFGHRRLSIIDLTKSGHQPMTDLSKQFTIVFNGEIYNYKEVKQKLTGLGYQFSSNSDTEVILTAFKHWHLDCVDHFIGMFAFAIFDRAVDKLYLCRDRIGIKPLYYYNENDVFMFASELKSFHKNSKFKKEIELNSVSDFLQTGYVTPNKSVFKNVNKLNPGHWLIYDIPSKSLKTEAYWSLSRTNSTHSFNSQTDIIEQLEPLMRSSFNYRLVSDVPVGIFLSGGVDSSLLTALLAQESNTQLTTFTIGFNEKDYDEAVYAREVANHFNTNHVEEYCSVKDAFNIFPKLANIYDEPFGDNSAIPMAMVSQIASKHLKVVLSADGGDELFAGYPSYKLVNSYLKYLFTIPKNSRAFVAKHIRAVIGRYRNTKKGSMVLVLLNILESKSYQSMSDAINGPFSNLEVSHLLNREWTKEDTSFLIKYSDDIVQELQRIDIDRYLLEDILVKVDRATMHASIESREPFLDHRLVEFAMDIPSKYNINGSGQKILLKEILKKYMPDYRFNRPKRGFDVPIGQWMKKELNEYYSYYLSETKIKESGIFNLAEVENYKKLFKEDKSIRGLHRKLWFILVYQSWSDRWMNQ